MTEFVQLLVTGVSQGCIFGLLAVAYNVTYSTSRTMNFSVGDLLMLGGVIGFSLFVDMQTGLPLGRSFVIPVLAVLVAGAILGALIHQTAVEPAKRSQAEYGAVLATLAAGGILRNLTERFWSTSDYKLVGPFGDEPIRMFGVGLFPQEILIVVTCILIVVVLEQFRRRTFLGRAIQAVAEDPEVASLSGINQKFVIRFSFVLSGMIAALAGLLVGPITLVSSTMGVVIGIKAYAVAIIGGQESGYGTLLGGLALGLTEAFAAQYISSSSKDVAGFILLIAIVVFKPNGLFGRRQARSV